MARVLLCLGALLLILAMATVLNGSREKFATLALRHPVISTTVSPMAERPIPAIPSSPSLEVPFWVLYVGPLLCLLISGIMLWRCHAAGACRWTRKAHSSHATSLR
ncbi:MAG TPA: hypothetical protein VGL77_09645 [Armatimonadota bacterium]|jgi:hypothetical protein